MRHTPLAGTTFFPSCFVSHWWVASTASILDDLHTSVWHLCEKFYCRTANSKMNTVTANLLLGVSTTAGSDKPWSRVLESDPVSVRTRYCLQEFPVVSFLVSRSTARISNRWVRGVRQAYGLLKSFTWSELGDTDCTENVEKYKRESETVTYSQSVVWVIAFRPLYSICSDIVVSSDTKYRTPAVLQVLVK